MTEAAQVEFPLVYSPDHFGSFSELDCLSQILRGSIAVGLRTRPERRGHLINLPLIEQAG